MKLTYVSCRPKIYFIMKKIVHTFVSANAYCSENLVKVRSFAHFSVWVMNLQMKDPFAYGAYSVSCHDLY